MREKYLLYIDVLGFRELVQRDVRRVYDLYRIVASLNVHRHPDFEAIVFSDTILIYNKVELTSGRDKAYTVMYLCEFVQDLQHRLIGRDIAFRAVLTSGEFEHYYLNEVPCFFGQALIDAYDAEKAIKATGLFISNPCQRFNQIFRTVPFNKSWNFVFLTQRLSEVEDIYHGLLPLPSIIAVDTDQGFLCGFEVLHLKAIYEKAKTHENPEVRAKYEKTWSFYSQRYPISTTKLIEQNFSLDVISTEVDWDLLRDRIREDLSWQSERRNVSTPERE